MNIVTITKDNKYLVVDNDENTIAEFGSVEDAKNFILANEETNPENIIENPFYEVDEHGQFIGN
jgi:hypothetical protein